MNPPETTRRPIKARSSRWAAATAGWLARRGVRPNAISVASAVVAALAGVALAVTPHVGAAAAAGLFVAGAVGVQLRLLCNLFDGMVAVEGGFRTKSGEVYNELPDRFADAFILVGCGYAAAAVPWGLSLGWTAAVLAVITAYVRTLGAAAGVGHCFLGPMAKPHRMAAVIGACLLAAVIGPIRVHGAAEVVTAALAIIVIGTLVTIVRRTAWVIRALEAR